MSLKLDFNTKPMNLLWKSTIEQIIFFFRHYVVPDLVQMRSDLVDWVEFYEVEEGDDAPLIDLNDDAKDISEDSSNGSNSTSEVDESRSSEPVVGKKKVEYIRLKPLQLCVVKIQNLLKVSRC
jgi:hypothetical protein